MSEEYLVFYSLIPLTSSKVGGTSKEKYMNLFCSQTNKKMDDIAKELAKLHVLTGADFSRQVERIAKMNVFRPLDGESNIFIAGGEQNDDFENLLNAARKAVEHGYRVFILPNPKGIRTADFILE
ncbi:MAG: hypothetical protein J6I37_01770 [Prevotella sp.]|nr:hypothetical protein [Prevotella sp.]